MRVKIHLTKKKISLGVGDLVAEPLASAGRVSGLSVWTRMALGREAHVNHQRLQAGLSEGYAREIVVRYTHTLTHIYMMPVVLAHQLSLIFLTRRCTLVLPLRNAALSGRVR